MLICYLFEHKSRFVGCFNVQKLIMNKEFVAFISILEYDIIFQVWMSILIKAREKEDINTSYMYTI